MQVEHDIGQYDTTDGVLNARPWEAAFRRKRSIWYPWCGVGGKDAETIFEVISNFTFKFLWLRGLKKFWC